MLDYPLHTVLSMLGIENTITIFKCAMLEQRILITGSKYNRLVNCDRPVLRIAHYIQIEMGYIFATLGFNFDKK